MQFGATTIRSLTGSVRHPSKGKDLFTGYGKRHVLAEGETVLDILLPAARMAIDDAGLEARQIDMVIGCVSPSTFILPSDLFALTQRLQLPETTLTIPLGNDFNNFNVGVALADALVRAGRSPQHPCRGGRRMDARHELPNGRRPSALRTAPRRRWLAWVAPDRQPRWTVVDTEVIAQEQNFGDMYLIGDIRGSQPGPGSATHPTRIPCCRTGRVPIITSLTTVFAFRHIWRWDGADRGAAPAAAPVY